MSTRYFARIENYAATYFGVNKGITHEYRAIIGLGGRDGHVGTAYFHSDPATLPHQDKLDSHGHLDIHFSLEDYSHVLDLLRNESPVYLTWEDGMGRIRTAYEPAGEEETS